MKMHRRAGYSRRSFLAGTDAVAAGLTFGPKISLGAGEKKVNLYNRDTYIGETTYTALRTGSNRKAKELLISGPKRRSRHR